MKTMETYFQNSAQRPLCYGEVEARREAKWHLFDNVVIFDFGTTGMFIGDLIKQKYPHANIVFVARSPESSPKVRFALSVAPAKYVQSVGDDKAALAGQITDALGGRSSLFIGTSCGSVEHEVTLKYRVLGYNEIVSLIDKGEFTRDPIGAYNDRIYAKGSPLKTAVIWNKKYVE